MDTITITDEQRIAVFREEIARLDVRWRALSKEIEALDKRLWPLQEEWSDWWMSAGEGDTFPRQDALDSLLFERDAVADKRVRVSDAQEAMRQAVDHLRYNSGTG